MSLDMKKYDYLLECNKKYMDLTALTFGDLKITYEELHFNIEKYAKLLYKKGIREGDLIGVCALNTPQSIYLLYALNVIGAVVVGYSPLDNKEKIKRDIELTKPKMVITVDMMYSNFKDLEKALNFSTILYSPMESVNNLKLKFGYNLLQLKNHNFTFDKNSKLSYLLKQDLTDELVMSSLFHENQVSDIMFTGGSTGVHKGVDLSDNGLNYVVEGMNDIFDAHPGMVHLGNIPVGHMVFGRLIMHYSLCNNLQLALTLKAMPKDFYDELVRTGAEAAVGGPPHWVSLLEQDGLEFKPSGKIVPGSLKNLHYATSGGEAKKYSTDAAINEALKYGGSDARLGDGLGATEAWASIIINNPKKHTVGTSGKAIPTVDVALVDPETKEKVKDGEAGLLCVSGPSVMLGYHDNPEETDKVTFYDENGKRWVIIGDYMRHLESGEFKYLGRQKRNFVSGVENIYPEELENIIASFPEVREALVTPISDEMVQFIPRYHISLYTDEIDYKDFEERLKDTILSKLSISWLPGDIKYTTEPLKRMSNSKVDVSYYKSMDEEDLANGFIDNSEAKSLRLKNI